MSAKEETVFELNDRLLKERQELIEVLRKMYEQFAPIMDYRRQTDVDEEELEKEEEALDAAEDLLAQYGF